MSNYEKARKFREEFDKSEVFGGKITFRQLWWMVKLAKTVRKYARSNAALYNLLNELFKGIASFKEVEKVRIGKTGHEEYYRGLEIIMNNSDETEMTNIEDDEL